MTTFKILVDGKEIATLRDKNHTDELKLSGKLRTMYSDFLNIPQDNVLVEVWDGKTKMFTF